MALFDIEAARADGHSDEYIADFLAQQLGKSSRELVAEPDKRALADRLAGEMNSLPDPSAPAKAIMAPVVAATVSREQQAILRKQGSAPDLPGFGGAVAEFVGQGVSGAIGQGGQLIGEGLKGIDRAINKPSVGALKRPDKQGVLGSIGDALSEGGRIIQEAHPLSKQSQESDARRMVMEGAKAAGSMLPTTVFPALLTGGTAGAVIGSSIYGLAQFNDTYEKSIKGGLTPGEAFTTAAATGAVTTVFGEI